ncbi:MAG: hypothetical protein OHK0056_27520 [Bacteriovoracaceae bacterium]
MDCCNGKLKKNHAPFITGMLCYCFQFSEDDLKNALNENREAEFIVEINSRIRSQGCDCENLNPTGKCCIPSIKKIIENKRS